MAKKAKTKKRKPTAADVMEHRVREKQEKVRHKKLLAGGPKDGDVLLNPFEFQLSILERRDGVLAGLDNMFNVAHSRDGARSWTRPRKMPVAKGHKLGHGGDRYANGWLRLSSGRIGLSWTEAGQITGRHRFVRLWWQTSSDEGKTWTKPVLINPTGWPGQPYYDTLRLTRSGRLLLPVRMCLSAGERDYERMKGGRGWCGGKKLFMEGHCHFPEMDITLVYYSDDEGKTWSRSEGEIIGWLDDGWSNYVACDEPNLEELPDGRILMLMRTTVGRLLAAESDDGGEHWSRARPTPLACSYSPCALKRIPETGDLLCVWNQVGADEIRLGYRRGRLSAAVSSDGENWAHFRTFERHGILEDAGRVEPEEKIQMCRGLSDFGQVHPDWGTSDYATINFYKDEVIVTYCHMKGVGPEKRVYGMKTCILPLDWFYSVP